MKCRNPESFNFEAWPFFEEKKFMEMVQKEVGEWFAHSAATEETFLTVDFNWDKKDSGPLSMHTCLDLGFSNYVFFDFDLEDIVDDAIHIYVENDYGHEQQIKNTAKQLRRLADKLDAAIKEQVE